MSQAEGRDWLAEQVVRSWLGELHGQEDELCPYVRDAEMLAFGLLENRDADEASRHIVDCAAFRAEFVRSAELAARSRGTIAMRELGSIGADVRESWTRWTRLAVQAPDATSDDRFLSVPVREEPGRRLVATRHAMAAIDNSGRLALDLGFAEDPPSGSILEVFLDGGGRTLRLARISVEGRRARGIVDFRPLGTFSHRIPSRFVRGVLTVESTDLLGGVVAGDAGAGADVLRAWLRVASEQECWDWIQDYSRSQGPHWAETLSEEVSSQSRAADALRWVATRVKEYVATWRQVNGADPGDADGIEHGLERALARLETVDIRKPDRRPSAETEAETVVPRRRSGKLPPSAPKVG